MTDDAIAIIAATVPPTIVALATLIVSIKNNLQNKALEVKASKIEEQNDTIHVLVNSNMTAVKADLASARREISVLLEDREAKRLEIAEKDREIAGSP